MQHVCSSATRREHGLEKNKRKSKQLREQSSNESPVTEQSINHHVQELARPDGSPRDVDREFAMMFAVAHERKTFFSAENLATFLPNSSYSNLTAEELLDLHSNLLDEDDSENDADLFYAINGAQRVVVCTDLVL